MQTEIQVAASRANLRELENASEFLKERISVAIAEKETLFSKYQKIQSFQKLTVSLDLIVTYKTIFILHSVALPNPHNCLFHFYGAEKCVDPQEYLKIILVQEVTSCLCMCAHTHSSLSTTLCCDNFIVILVGVTHEPLQNKLVR